MAERILAVLAAGRFGPAGVAGQLAEPIERVNPILWRLADEGRIHRRVEVYVLGPETEVDDRRGGDNGSSD